MFRTVESILRAVFMKPDSFQSLQLELDSKKKELSKVYGRIEKHVEKVVSNFIKHLVNSFSLSRNSSRTKTNDRRSCSRNSTIKTSWLRRNIQAILSNWLTTN